ncbi:MAG: hypothetical protein PQJ60_07565 [Spirochaetales bacterium]|nr:hypothetical protein [Spirochaetales bacterium]
MSRRRGALFIFGALVLLIVALSIGFGGAEKRAEQSMGAEGFGIFHRLLKKNRFDLKGYRNESVFDMRDEAAQVIIVREGEDFTKAHWEKALAWSEQTEGLLILSGLPRGKTFLNFWPSAEESTAVPRLRQEGGQSWESPSGEYEYHSLESAGEGEPLISLSDGRVLAYFPEEGRGHILLISDDGFLRNRSLLENDHALLVSHMLGPYGEFPFYYFSPRENRPYLGMQVLTRGALGLLLFQLVLFALAGAWNRAVRVGPPDVARRSSRREMGEHLVAVGRFYSRTRHWGLLDRMEGQFFLQRVQELLPFWEADKARERLGDYADPETVRLALSEAEDQEGWKRAMESRERIIQQIEKGQRRNSNGNS